MLGQARVKALESQAKVRVSVVRQAEKGELGKGRLELG